MGSDRIWVNSAADWGPPTPDVVPAFIHEMKMRGRPEALVRKVAYENPIAFLSQCRRWRFTPPDATKSASEYPCGTGVSPVRLEGLGTDSKSPANKHLALACWK